MVSGEVSISHPVTSPPALKGEAGGSVTLNEYQLTEPKGDYFLLAQRKWGFMGARFASGAR